MTVKKINLKKITYNKANQTKGEDLGKLGFSRVLADDRNGQESGRIGRPVKKIIIE